MCLSTAEQCLTERKEWRCLIWVCLLLSLFDAGKGSRGTRTSRESSTRRAFPNFGACTHAFLMTSLGDRHNILYFPFSFLFQQLKSALLTRKTFNNSHQLMLYRCGYYVYYDHDMRARTAY